MLRSVILVLVFAGLALPAVAASNLTARASGVEAVHTGPGSRWPIIGKLGKNERVRVDQCTRKARWCHVVTLDGKLAGWVAGDYLVGAPAKNAVTPFEFSFDPMRPGAFAGHGSGGRY